MNFAPLPQQQQQQHPLPNDQWAIPPSSAVSTTHLHMHPQHQQSHTIHNMQQIPLQQQQQVINNK